MTIRPLLAALTLALIGCSHPKAIVVDEPTPGRKQRTDSAQDELLGGEVVLRDPDVVSELPDEQRTGSAAATRPGTPDSSGGTVIARPPASGEESE